MTARKELFAPLPARALSDMRLGAHHLRVLGVVALHDRLGRNKRGCYIGRKRMAQESGMSEVNVSHALSDLRMWGYITSELHPNSKRSKVHRVIYTDADAAVMGVQDSTYSSNTTGVQDNTYSANNGCAEQHLSTNNRCANPPRTGVRGGC